jgi:ComF family protein
VLDLLLPPTCVACSYLLRDPAPLALPLCSNCALSAVPLPRAERRIDGIDALYAYEGALAQALTRLKFGGHRALAGPLGRLLAAGIGPTPWDLVTTAPLHPWRAFCRGYDQAALLAHYLVQAWPRAPRPRLHLRLLRRDRRTLPQTELDRRARLRNVEGAFSPLAAALKTIQGRRILLIDDVTTTGATISAARDALLRAGAAEVGGLALLRALP